MILIYDFISTWIDVLQQLHSLSTKSSIKSPHVLDHGRLRCGPSALSWTPEIQRKKQVPGGERLHPVQWVDVLLNLLWGTWYKGHLHHQLSQIRLDRKSWFAQRITLNKCLWQDWSIKDEKEPLLICPVN